MGAVLDQEPHPVRDKASAELKSFISPAKPW
jgi:hypothetical protein